MRRAFVAAVAAAFAPDSARACGGFFCNSSAPVEQSAEQIAFFVEGGDIAVHIQIRYAGPSDDFAWILPLPAEPSLDVGTDELFRVLVANAAPLIWEDWEAAWCPCGGCDDGYDDDGCEGEAEAEGEGGVEGEGEVVVEFRGAVGPYDAAVITSDDPEALTTWLSDNGYDLPDGADALIDDYVAIGSYFVALKLLPDSDTGDIVPLIARFAYDTPCIPIRLTSVAAQSDMPIRAWVFEDRRAVSTNYALVDLDWAAFPWGCVGDPQAYWDFVSRAVDEAGGRAFVTEHAGTTAPLSDTLYWEGRFDLAALSGMTQPAAFLLEIGAQGFPRNAQLLAILATYVPPDDGWEAIDFYNYVFSNCWCASSAACECYDSGVEAYLDAMEFDAEAATAELETYAVAPLAGAQASIDDATYVTTLATTLSPDEMILDPLFAFNDAMPDVARERVAVVTGTCEGGAPMYHLDAPDEDTVIDLRGKPYYCVDPSSSAPVGTWARLLADLPASRASWQASASETTAVYDNGTAIEEILAAHNAAADDATYSYGYYDCGESESEGESEAEAEGEGEGEGEGDWDLDDDGYDGDTGGVDPEGGVACACAVGSNGRAPAFLWLMGVFAAALAWRRGRA